MYTLAASNINVIRQLLIDLVNLGLDPILPDLDGNTPLHIAAKFKKVEVFKDLMLITSGFISLTSLPFELWYKIIFQVGCYVLQYLILLLLLLLPFVYY